MVRTIKRYANRKLYDTSQSSYVTLDEISELVQNGEEVRIIDNTSSEDLTAVTLAQILFEAEKRKKKTLPLATLRQLIQSGGELLEKKIARPVVNFRDETVNATQKAYQDFQKSVDDNVKNVRATVTQLVSPGGDLSKIHDRLDALEKRLDALEKGGQS